MAQAENTRSRESDPGTPDAPRATPSWRAWLGALALVAAPMVSYQPAMHGEVQWDDAAHMTRGDLRSADGLWRIWFEPRATQQYYPLLHTAFWLEYQSWQSNTTPYHWINVIQHAISALLLWAVLWKLQVPGAYLAAMIFVVHPVNVESVAWITEQKNTLSMVFYLQAAWCYLTFRELRSGDRRGAMVGWYAAALLAFILGLLTKTVIATLPAALLVGFWWQRGHFDRAFLSDALWLLPFFVLGAIGGGITATVERTLIGASGADFDLSLVQRFLLAGRVIWFYLEKLFWPVDLMFFYPRWTIDPSDPTWWLYPLGVLALGAALLLLARRWRAPLAAFSFFVGTLFPVLGFLNVYPFRFSYVADHFQYLAAVGIFAFAAGCVTTLLGRIAPPSRHVGRAFVLSLVATLGLLTWRQSALFGGSATDLYRTTFERNPTCWICQENWGGELLTRGLTGDERTLRQAIPHFEKALEIHPGLREALRDLANTYAALGEFDAAIPLFQRSLAIPPDDPGTRGDLGQAYLRQGRFEDAREQFDAAIRVAEARAPVALGTLHGLLGKALARLGRFDEAIAEYETALALDPVRVELHIELAVVHSQQGRRAEALHLAKRAMQLVRAKGSPDQIQQAARELTPILGLAADAARPPGPRGAAAPGAGSP